LSETVDAYLTFSFTQLSGKQKHRFVRDLFRLSQRIAAGLFEKAVSRALSYRVTDPDTLYRIAVLMLKETNYQSPWVPIDVEFTSRPSFLEGRFTDDVDLSVYTDIGEDEDGSGTDQDA
jgi:hypothetical protein